MADDNLVNMYLEYLNKGISYDSLYSMMQYDYDLYMKKLKGEIDSDIQTDIHSKLDAKIKYESLKKAYDVFHPIKYSLLIRFMYDSKK